MISIALIDKFPILRIGLSMHLKKYFKEITIWEMENTADFQASYLDVDPDIIIIGINLYSTAQSTENINTLLNENPKSRIIVYDEKPDATLLNDYFRNGVAGYLSKQNRLSELIECIEVVTTGKIYICKELLPPADNNFLKA